MKRVALAVLSRLGRALRHTPLAKWRWLGHLHGKMTNGLGNAGNIAVGAFWVSADPRDEVITKKLILYGEYEGREIELLCSFTRPGDCALDVGANIGLYTLALSRAVGPLGHVIAVEPDPDNLVLLRKNLKTNNCNNVTVIEEALGNECKIAKLYQSRDNRGALSTADIFGVGEGNTVSIRMRRADDVFIQTGRSPRIAKIDVEGQEPLVIAGMGSHLPDVLLFEFMPTHLRSAGHDPSRFLEEMQGLGYSLSLVLAETGERCEMTLDAIVQTAEAGTSVSNILALRARNQHERSAL